MMKIQFQLPATEDDLWNEVLIRLLAQRDISERDAQNHLRLLEELAFHSRFCGKPLTYNFAEGTGTWLAQEKGFGNPREEAQKWLKDLEQWELLVHCGSGYSAIYEFAISMLDEYFAARHIVTRWVEGDNYFRSWIRFQQEEWISIHPIKRYYAERYCYNPICRAILPSFWPLITQADYEEILLLFVGLLKDAEREESVLNEISIRPLKKYPSIFFSSITDSLRLKVLSRCRYVHVNFAMNFAEHYIMWKPESYWTLPWFEYIGTPRIRENFELVIDRYIRALCDSDPEVRRSAAWALMLISSAITIDSGVIFIELLKDEDSRVRDVAYRALYYISDYCRDRNMLPIDTLVTGLKDENIETAYSQCIRYDSRGMEPLIIAVLRNQDEKVRRKATFALLMLLQNRDQDHWWIIPVLPALLNDPSEEVRKLGEIGLNFIGLRGIDNVNAVELLIVMLNDTQAEVRMSAAYALGNIGDTRVIPAMEILLNDPDTLVSQAAKKAVDQIKQRNASINGK